MKKYLIYSLLILTVSSSSTISADDSVDIDKNLEFHHEVTISTKEEIEAKINHIESEKDVIIMTKEEIEAKKEKEELAKVKKEIKASVNKISDLTDEQKNQYNKIIDESKDKEYIKKILESAKEQALENKEHHTKETTTTYTESTSSYGINDALKAFERITNEYNISDSDKATWAEIIRRESGWNVQATNPTSGAYGLPQSLPGTKMAAAGSDYLTNPYTQLKWMYNYMVERYGSISGAMSFWNANHWY